MVRLFFRKSVDILLALNKLKVANISKLSEEAKMTYTQTYEYVKLFEQRKYIKEVKSEIKREKLYELTEKGKKISNLLSKVLELI